jgi:hypothetical protein
MSEAPYLTITEVRQEVERIFRRSHRSQLVALFGRGDAETFDVGDQVWRVVPTRCELDLRERLPRPDDSPREARVYLIDWTADALPLDVACRLAGGRLYHVARDARLAALFGARQVEAGLAGSAVAKLFLSAAVPAPRKVPGLLLTRSAAWQSLLEAKLRVPEAALLSVGALLGWAVPQEGGPAFVRQVDGDDLWRAARRELHTWLGANREGGGAGLGEAGVVVWRAWELGLAGRLLEVLPLLAAARIAGDAFLSGQLAGQLSSWLPDLSAAVRTAEPVLAQSDVLDAALPAERGPLLARLERSQVLADSAGLGALTVASERLPGGHAARERSLAAAVGSFLAQPDFDHSAKIVEAHAHLERHALDGHLRHEDHREARRNLPRLALWLATQPAHGPAGTRWQPAVDLARRYVEEGGHVEWSRQQLRGLRGADEVLLAAARALEGAVSTALQGDNRAFAEAYVSWVEAGKPSAFAMPIEDIGKHVIAPFLKGGTRRKLLVILMDGMSQAAATQLLTRLSTARRWGPIAWRREGWRGALPLPPVLAAAPTLTEISRGAFFAGKAEARFGEEGTDKDPARWGAHRAVAELLGEGPPPLFVRRDILSGHDLADDVRGAIESDCRAVAVVVNAIDEDLKGSLQVAKDYSRAPVLPLDALLSAAEDSDRAVLLVADHGHVLGDGTRSLSGRLGGRRPGGPRWRALAEGEAPAEEEVLLPRSAWTPRGWARIAALWDPLVVNRSANYGEHGGLSLAETVAPVWLIAPDWLEGRFPDDPDLAVRALPVPDWWGLRVRKSSPRPSPVVQPVPAPRGQPSLFTTLPVSTSAPPPAPAPPAFVDALRRSPVFQAQVHGQAPAEVERVLSWLAALVEAGGTLPAADFAVAAGVRVHQVGGAVARMGVLNADGFAMVEHDHVGRRVVVHRARLVQHYGVRE